MRRRQQNDMLPFHKLTVQALAYYLPGWRFRYHYEDESKAYGRCFHEEQLITIKITHVLYGSPGEIVNTISHEIAHGLAGREAGHGPKWDKIFKKILKVMEKNAKNSQIY